MGNTTGPTKLLKGEGGRETWRERDDMNHEGIYGQHNWTQLLKGGWGRKDIKDMKLGRS